MTTLYGQSDAVAVAVAAALTANSANFCLTVAAERLFARKLDVGAISSIGQPVTIEVIPGEDSADLAGLSRMYDDTYGCHVTLLQNIGDPTRGGYSESQATLLVALRSQIVEFLAKTALVCPEAVHPFSGAFLKHVRPPKEGDVYDLTKLESTGLFYSELILTYKMPGLRR